LILVIPISVALGLVAGHSWERRVQESVARACAVVGTGNDQYQQAFYEAYKRNGGAAALGCPLGPVLALEGAYHQNLDGPKGRSVIMATEPDKAYVLTGAPYAAYLAIGNGDGVQSSVLAGFPYSDVVHLRDGGKIELGAGGHWPRSGLAGRRTGPWFWMPDKLWGKYSGDLGGPDGCLGYPIGPSQPWENGIRQDFEHGSLSFRQDLGAVTNAGCPEGNRTDPRSTAPVLPEHALVYQVDADHGIPHEIPPTKSAWQDFTPSLPFVDEVGIIAGVDPAKRTSPQHPITLQLLDQDKNILFGRQVPLIENRLTTANFRPIPVVVGKAYWLRATNDSADVIGLYLNDPARPNQVASPTARALLDGELPNPRPHRDEKGALCGRIDGTSG